MCIMNKVTKRPTKSNSMVFTRVEGADKADYKYTDKSTVRGSAYMMSLNIENGNIEKLLEMENSYIATADGQLYVLWPADVPQHEPGLFREVERK